jgi:aminopeptidase 2
VNEVFDSISYNKGASVIRMMFDWLTTEVGLKGIHAYLSRFAHSNAVTTDLWAALQEASGLPVGDVMRNWTLLPGHPFVAVSSSQAADGGALARGSLKLSSKRFTAPWAASSTAWPAAADFPGGAGHAGFEAACAAHGGAGSAEACDDWNIPISVVTGSAGASGGAGGAAAAAAVGTARKLGVLMLDDPKKRQSREATLAATAEAIAAAAAEGGAGWVKLNADHAAFFRTVYDGALLARLHAAVRTPADGAGEPALGINDRLGLVGDVGAAVSIGLTPAADLLPLLWEMRHEREYTVWVSMTDALAAVQAAADGVSKELGSQVTAFTRALLQPVVERVGWEADPAEQPNVALLRALVLRAAAIADNETVVAEALRRFDAYAAGGAPISADLKQLVYNTAAASGGAARWHAIHKLFGAAGSSEEQRRLMTALGRASDPALLQRTLGMLLSEEIRSQDAPFVLDAVASNPGSAGRDAAWGLLTGQWDAMSKRFGGGNFLWQSLVGSACGSFDTREKATEVEAWFADPAHPSGSAERTIRQKLEAIRNRAWRRHLLSREAEALPAVLRRLSGGAK